MIAKFKTEDGWRYFADVQQANIVGVGVVAGRESNTAATAEYRFARSSPAKWVDLLIPAEGWVAVVYDREAYLCTDKGETINAI